MKAVIQRVHEASVSIQGIPPRAISRGLVIFLGIARSDTPAQITWLAQKIANLRIMEDTAGKMNQSLIDIQGDALIVSQFTLLADTRKGKRPSFNPAAPPEIAVPLYQQFIQEMSTLVQGQVQTGEFGADMDIALTNHGPVTIVLETDQGADAPSKSK